MEEIVWGPPPPAVPAGAQFAIIQGDPSLPGAPYTFRVKVPAGFSFPPHWHSMDEQMTVLEGAIRGPYDIHYVNAEDDPRNAASSEDQG